MGALCRFGHVFSLENKIMFVQSNILSVLDYGDILYLQTAHSTPIVLYILSLMVVS